MKNHHVFSKELAKEVNWDKMLQMRRTVSHSLSPSLPPSLPIPPSLSPHPSLLLAGTLSIQFRQ